VNRASWSARGKARAAALLLALAAGGASALFAGCLAPAGCAGTDDAAVVVQCGDFSTFPDVSSVLEARCGTLDCHGSLSRPLRIYGRTGLRRPVDFNAEVDDTILEIDAGPQEYYPGGLQPTTPTELKENYRSVCGLEPELTSLVNAGTEEPEVLTLIRKARLLEKHKGGKIFTPNDSPGDRCLTSWLTAPVGLDGGGGFQKDQCLLELEEF
jgi:hypothetical protein